MTAPLPPQPTPLAAALARVGDRWSLLLIDALLDRPQRFNELQEAVAGISTNVLAGRLKQLEAERVVLARPYQQRPTRHSYELTAAGRDLAGSLRLLAQWGGEQEGERATAHEHPACGSTLEVRWYCPTCDEVVDTDDLDDTAFV